MKSDTGTWPTSIVNSRRSRKRPLGNSAPPSIADLAKQLSLQSLLTVHLLNPFRKWSMRTPRPPCVALLRFLAAVLRQIKVDEAEAGGSWMRVVNSDNAELMGGSGANFVIGGGVRVAASNLSAGKATPRDSQGPHRFTLVALQYFTVT